MVVFSTYKTVLLCFEVKYLQAELERLYIEESMLDNRIRFCFY